MGWLEAHRRLARGEARGAERLLAVFLGPAALLYGGAAWLRNRAYDSGLLAARDAPVKVISVGSLSAGGSGKTPLAALIARRLHAGGRHPLLVARGYGAPRPRPAPCLVSRGAPSEAPLEGWETVGEEAILLARLSPEVPVAVARRREEAWQAARELGIETDVLVVDGGFQHRRLKRDLDIVALDASLPPGRSHLIPWGDRREGWSSLRRADWVVLHRAELCAERTAWEASVRRHAGAVPLAWCENRLQTPRSLTGEATGWEALRDGRWGVWTALAAPESFVAGLAARGVQPAWVHAARDHAPFGPEDGARLTNVARRRKLSGFLVTEKDAVKMEAQAASLPTIFVVPAELAFVSGEPDWIGLLD